MKNAAPPKSILAAASIFTNRPAKAVAGAAVLLTGLAVNTSVADAQLTCNGKAATIVFDGEDASFGVRHKGTMGDDVIWITADFYSNQPVNTLAGDDTVCDLTTSTDVNLGRGDDTYINPKVEAYSDVHGGPGEDYLEGSPDLFGDRGWDILVGSSGRDVMRGGFGNDRLYGLNGTDSMYGGPGADKLLGQGGYDFLHGGFGNDWLNGGASSVRDIMYGDGGFDRAQSDSNDGIYDVEREINQSVAWWIDL